MKKDKEVTENLNNGSSSPAGTEIKKRKEETTENEQVRVKRRPACMKCHPVLEEDIW